MASIFSCKYFPCILLPQDYRSFLYVTHTGIHTCTYTCLHPGICCGVQTDATLVLPRSLSLTSKSCMACNEREEEAMSVLLTFSPSGHYRGIHMGSCVMNPTFSPTLRDVEATEWFPTYSRQCSFIGSFPSPIHSESLTKDATCM